MCWLNEIHRTALFVCGNIGANQQNKTDLFLIYIDMVGDHISDAVTKY